MRLPLEWCFQPAVKLDFRHFPGRLRGHCRDVEAELERIGHTLRPLEIVSGQYARRRTLTVDDYSTAAADAG